MNSASFFSMFLLIFICSVSAIAQTDTGIVNVFNDPIVHEEGLLSKKVDLNRDGKPEIWIYSLRDGGVQKVERDLDLDGRIDAVQWTFLRDNKIGQFDKIMYDENVDGKIERIEYYNDQNKVIRTEVNPEK